MEREESFIKLGLGTTRKKVRIQHIKTLYGPICNITLANFNDFQGHPIKVIDFGTNRKRICDFLLVRYSNLGLIMHRFGYIAGFFCAPE